MTNVAADETQPEMLDAAERKPVPVPEAKDAPKAPLHPQPALIPMAVTPEVGNSIIVLESVREKAEQNLTHYLAPKLVQALKDRGQSDGMIAALVESSHVSLFGELNHGKTDIKITVTGPNVGPNEALIGELLVEALRQHPLAPVFSSAEKPLHAQKIPGQEHTGLQVHIPEMETALYAQLMQGLAAGNAPQAATQPALAAKKDTPGAEHVASQETAAHAEGCACGNCAASPAANDHAEVHASARPPVNAEKPANILTEVAKHQQQPTPSIAIG